MASSSLLGQTSVPVTLWMTQSLTEASHGWQVRIEEKRQTVNSCSNLKAGNGKVILTSQLYRAKAAAQGGIESVKQHAADESNFERKTSAQGNPYFVLKATNTQVIGSSEMYTSTSAREKRNLLRQKTCARRRRRGFDSLKQSSS